MSVTRAALVGSVLAIVCTFFRRSTWMTPKSFCDSLVSAGRTAIGLGAVGCTSGMVIGIIGLSGVGMRLTESVVHFAGGSLLITMFLAMIASLVLGMGIPTTANYLITSTVAAPVLIKFGVAPLAAHMFCFYFGLLADITPPVAVAVFAASGIAGSDPIETSIKATKLAIAAFIVPFLFVQNTSLLMIDVSVWVAVRVFCTAIIGMFAIASSVSGWLYEKTKWYERLLGFIGGIILVEASWETDLIGFVILIIVYGPHYLRRRKESR